MRVSKHDFKEPGPIMWGLSSKDSTLDLHRSGERAHEHKNPLIVENLRDVSFCSRQAANKARELQSSTANHISAQ